MVMGRSMSIGAHFEHIDPKVAAEQLFEAHRDEQAWLDAFSENLRRCRTGKSLATVQAVWGLNQAETARLFGVSRQAVSKWLSQGVPAERMEALSDLAAATDLLVRYLKADRIPAVVRRPMAALEGVTLVDLLAQGDTKPVLAACRRMFQFEQTQS